MSKTNRGPKCRHWCFTANNYKEEPSTYIGLWPYTYLVIGKEVGESGTPHLQGYVYLKKPAELSFLRKLLNCHWEPMQGTPEQASTYCKKDGDFVEDGDVPLPQHKAGNEANKLKYTTMWELAKKGDIEAVAELDPRSAIVHYRTLKQIGLDHRSTPVARDCLDNIWVWGLSGCGKSRTSKEVFPGSYYKAVQHKWWDGYDPKIHSAVIMEDIDPQHHYQAHNFKIWLDYEPFYAEVKGGQIQIRPKNIVITSQYPPDKVFLVPEDLAAVRRRCKVIHLLTYTGKFE